MENKKNVSEYKPKCYIPTFQSKDELGNPCHIYKDDTDTIIPSVTTLLKDILGIYQYKHTGSSYAATRGTFVHLACQAYDEHDLVESTLDPVLVPYLKRYKEALLVNNITIEANELPRFHPQLRFAGTMDKIAIINPRH